MKREILGAFGGQRIVAPRGGRGLKQAQREDGGVAGGMEASSNMEPRATNQEGVYPEGLA